MLRFCSPSYQFFIARCEQRMHKCDYLTCAINQCVCDFRFSHFGRSLGRAFLLSSIAECNERSKFELCLRACTNTKNSKNNRKNGKCFPWDKLYSFRWSKKAREWVRMGWKEHFGAIFAKRNTRRIPKYYSKRTYIYYYSHTQIPVKHNTKLFLFIK